MVVKANQPALLGVIEQLFTAPPPVLATDWAEVVTTTTKGLGRLDPRTLERSAALNAYLEWPAVGQVRRRTCQQVELLTGVLQGVLQEETTYGIASLSPTDASAATLEALWRGHWAIETKVHQVRDATFGEDACQVHRGQAPPALAALRNGLLSLLRTLGWTNIADADRHYAAFAHRAIRLLSTAPPRR